MKLRRSVLYVPGNKQRALEKSRSLSVDCVVYDLEDSVGPAAKDEARDRVVIALSAGNITGQERIVRVNGLQSDWVEQDLAIMKQAGADAILLPKINSADDVRSYRKLLGQQDKDIPAFWIMAETAAGILNMSSIAAADPAISTIMMGLEDLALETRIRRTAGREGFLYALSACVIAARAHDLEIIDSVYTAFGDETGFMVECRQANDLGFDGKSLIHPRQVEICNQCFSPSADEVVWAEKIVAVWEQQSEGQSVVVVNGRMIEHLHVSEARRVLALAAAVDTKT
jgi:citrate lyase subunit beta/citryl-CoA lyase